MRRTTHNKNWETLKRIGEIIIESPDRGKCIEKLNGLSNGWKKDPFLSHSKLKKIEFIKKIKEVF